ncbi:hypothetical protein RDWZM_006046 [Blomia tropicalis]|uniref:General transcription factor 3C polypeptide 5 n=1 Tax=Blomia tropicalis TaxID=40697 RepID=A0A9Q0M768_BLOTA|nr:General transcription factor 3C polypeptide 5 [Blomia tropicalis]KAJ6220234.1 hypothetical protein RDWZM_006046 [Blomia tropicalis]
MENSFGMKPRETKQMFCIDAPANVENIDNFIKCCGGLQTIQNTFQTPKERIQFKFRPEDSNTIPLFSGRKTSTDLAVKVRRKKKTDGSFDYTFETYGIIDTTFHFEDKICDLQLLPTQNDMQNELLKSDFILNCSGNFTFDNDDSTSMMKQFFYSRFTSPKSLFLEMSEQSKREQSVTNQNETICQLRKSRRMFGTFVKWEDVDLPMSLPQEYKDRIHVNAYEDPLAKTLQQLFEQRPIWSRLALLVQTKCRYTKLKYFLPIYSFWYLNGPFRNLWVRYGFNPKEERSSKIYQSIDCRYRGTSSEAFRNRVTVFKDHSISYKPDFVSPFHYLDESATGQDVNTENVDELGNECSYIFRPGLISIFNRTIYQLCDIEIDEVQNIIHANDGKESECTEKDGWLEKGAIDRIRKIMVSVANKMLEDPEIVKKVSKQDLSNLEIMDDIEVSEVYDNLDMFEDASEVFMIDTPPNQILE